MDTKTLDPTPDVDKTRRVLLLEGFLLSFWFGNKQVFIKKPFNFGVKRLFLGGERRPPSNRY